MVTAIRIDLSSLQGCTGVTLRRSDLQGGGNRVRERSTKSIRHKEAHPSAINREVIRRTISYVARLWTPTRTYSCTVRDWPAKQKQIAKHTPLERREDHTTSRQSARA